MAVLVGIFGAVRTDRLASDADAGVRAVTMRAAGTPTDRSGGDHPHMAQYWKMQGAPSFPGLKASFGWRDKPFSRLREICAERISELGLTTYANVDELCQHVSQLRNRPIVLMPVMLRPSDPCGMWLLARSEDLVFYEASTSRAHQNHIILHELGHIISCHRGSGELDDASMRQLFPSLDPALVRDMLMRTTYDDVREQEAEVIAYLLSQLIMPDVELPTRAPDSPLHRIARILG